ncbi:hypothetical protein Tco_1035253 [Tanacetum coccineum]
MIEKDRKVKGRKETRDIFLGYFGGKIGLGISGVLYGVNFVDLAESVPQSYKSSCMLSTKESIDAGQAGKKTVPSHEYILLPLCTPDSPISSSPMRSDDEVVDDAGKKSTKDPANEGKEAKININSTNSISVVSSPINTIGTKDADDEPMMPNLEDTGIFGDAYDDEDFVAGGDMDNLESSMSVNPIVTTRVRKDHPVE